MKKIRLIELIKIVVILTLFFPAPSLFAAEHASLVATKIGVNVARTVTQSENNTGRTVLILDELHNSRVAQLQEALILERLYYDYNVREIVLEGYLIGDKKLDTSWFNKIAGNDPIRQTKVAIQLLREGEINAAEYWKLVHSQVEIIPAETMSEYAHHADGRAHAAPEMYLLKIAGQSAEKALRSDSAKLKEYNLLTTNLDKAVKAFKTIGNDASDSEAEKKREEIRKAYNEYQAFIIKLDPWCDQTWEYYKKIELNSEAPSIEESCNIAKTIQDKAEKMGVQLLNEEKEAMAQYIAFMQARHEGTLKIAATLKNLCKCKGAPIVAIIGLGHSVDLINQLKDLNCSYALIRPLIIDKNRNNAPDIPLEMYERKYKRLSIYSEDLLSKNLDALKPPSQMKPHVVLNEPWLIGKIESYTFIDRITADIFGGGPPDEPPIVPSDWNDGSFRGEVVFIDPKGIEVIANDQEALVITDTTLKKMSTTKIPSFLLTKLEKLKDRRFLHENHLLRQVEILLGSEGLKKVKIPLLKHIEKVHQPAVLIPLVFYQGTRKEVTIWAKATQGQAHVPSEERKAAESMLQDVLEEIQNNKELTKSALDALGRVQIGLDTVVAFGKTSNIRQISLSMR